MSETNRREQVATWLRTAMAARRAETGKRWTRKELAEASGVSRQTLWSILDERSDARVETLATLAKALGVPFRAALDKSPSPPERLWVYPYQLSYTGEEWHWSAEVHQSSVIRQTEYVRADLVNAGPIAK